MKTALVPAFVLALMLFFSGLAVTACSPQADSKTAGDVSMLAQAMEGFSQAVPGYELSFPRDHGPHSDFRIEWWYLTANLQDARGEQYGAQWTLFRIAMQPASDQPAADGLNTMKQGNPWLSEQVFMAHAAVTWPQGHAGFQRYARGGDHDGVAQSGARAEPFAAWLDDWSLHSIGNSWLPLQAEFHEGDMAFHLRLDSDQALVLQGESGFSQKHASGSGSYYYSQPFLLAKGSLTIQGQETPVSGQAWLDREWSSQFLQPEQVGWDWFALHLDSGEKLMLFRLRQKQASASAGNYQHGVLISPTGVTTRLDSQQIEFEVLESMVLRDRRLPSRWRIKLPEIDREMLITPLVEDQWMDVDFAYWEGAIEVSGSSAGTSGRGYLEMTGYPFEPE
jgi:predicted secreted hydrolase